MAALLLAICVPLAGGATSLAACAGDGLALRWPWSPKPEGLNPRAPVDPTRQYHLVVWDYNLPLTSASGARFGEAAAEAIRRFEKRYPNATVDLVLVDPADGPAKLAEALAAGYPPDVYCSPFGLPASGSSLQIPVGLYLDYDTWARYHPVAWQTVKVDGTVWAYPRWLMLWPWLGNRDLLVAAGLDPDRISQAGWTREEFLAAAGRLAAGRTWDGTRSLAASSPAAVVRDLLFPGLLTGETAPASDSFWLGAEPGAVALWLSQLGEADALNQDGTGKNPGVVDSFVHGRAAVLASPTPWASLFLLEPVPRPAPWQYTLPDRSPPPVVLVPPPHGSSQPSVVWVSAATVSVFRQARYKGDDHTRLAVELARELSTGARPWLRDLVLCLPASSSELAAWEVSRARFGELGDFAAREFGILASLPPDRLSAALTILNYGPWSPRPGSPAKSVPEVTGQRREPDVGFACRGYLGPFLEALSPAAVRFWNGEASPGDFVNEITERVLRGASTRGPSGREEA